jgi:Holliday junction resolvase RusA-like endonuclease
VLILDPPLLQFTIPDEPQGKGRPRAARFGGHIKLYTPKLTVAYEQHVAAVAREAIEAAGLTVPVLGPVEVELVLIHARPGAMFARKFADGRIWRDRKPDADNVAKAITDGLSKSMLWRDDSQIARLVVEQFDGAVVDRKGKVSEAPCVLVTVRLLAAGGGR